MIYSLFSLQSQLLVVWRGLRFRLSPQVASKGSKLTVTGKVAIKNRILKFVVLASFETVLRAFALYSYAVGHLHYPLRLERGEYS